LARASSPLKISTRTSIDWVASVLDVRVAREAAAHVEQRRRRFERARQIAVLEKRNAELVPRAERLQAIGAKDARPTGHSLAQQRHRARHVVAFVAQHAENVRRCQRALIVVTQHSPSLG
jgi:hypothetical protein